MLEQKLEEAARQVLADDSGFTVTAYCGEDDENLAWQLFCAYRDKLQGIQGQLPCYPAVTVGDLAACLPTGCLCIP